MPLMSMMLMAFFYEVSMDYIDYKKYGSLFIDLSRCQGEIDWVKLKELHPEIQFAVTKCTEGTTYIDPTYLLNTNGALSVSMTCGAYHFFRWTDSVEQQIASFLSNSRNADFLALDIEQPYKQPHHSIVFSKTEQFIRGILRASNKPICIYTGGWYLPQFSAIANECPLWVANYAVTDPSKLKIASPWTKASAWQFGNLEYGVPFALDKRVVRGATKPVSCDINVVLDAGFEQRMGIY
jgi:lysozyme